MPCRLLFAVVGISIIVVGLSLSVFREASRELDRVERSSSAAYGFQTRSLTIRSSSFGIVRATPTWIDGVALGSTMYLASPNQVSRLEGNGKIEPFLQTGSQLPTGKLTCLASGLDPLSGERRLFIGTAGAGLAIVSPDGKTELVLPDETEFRDITALLPLTTGQLVVGTQQGGVAVFDGERFAPYLPDHEQLSSGHVTTLAGNDSELWIGTLRRGAFRWLAGTVVESEGLPDQQVLSLAWSVDAAYVGTPIGVAEYRDGTFERVLADGFFATALALDKDKLWVGSLDEGIVEIPLNGARVRPGRPRAEIAGINRILTTTESIIALASSGVWELDLALGWTAVADEPTSGLTDGNISALKAVGQDLWVGYFDRGLDLLRGGEVATHVEDEHIFCVNRIVEDPDRDRILVATANGLAAFDTTGSQQEFLRKSEGLIADHVTDVATRANGIVAATPAGLTFLDQAGTRSLYSFHGLVNNHVYSLGVDGERLLAGTLGGLSSLAGDRVIGSFTTANSQLEHNWISAIEPYKGGWMVGTYGTGVIQFDATGNWIRFPDMGGREVNPNAMLSREESVFAGLLDGGLLVFNGDRWKLVREGLPSQNVTALELANGRLWVGTDNGLAYIQKSSLPGR